MLKGIKTEAKLYQDFLLLVYGRDRAKTMYPKQ